MSSTPMTRAKLDKTATKASQKKSTSSEDSLKEILARKSSEIVIGICGAIGSVTAELVEALESKLLDIGYNVKKIKISDLIEQYTKEKRPTDQSVGERYDFLQKSGNKLREDHRANILAKLAIREISIARAPYLDNPEEIKTTQKVAYIINQIKHPDEIQMLKAVYKQNFYLIGIYSTENDRKTRLKERGATDSEIANLIIKDRKDEESYGQQVEKAFHLADYFINYKQNTAALAKAIKRFLDLAHGINGISPSLDEKGMYSAFSASLQSACLSRQVGAAIFNSSGDLLSTGCNDVPSYGGGLYSSEDGDDDKRCVFKGGKCYNDQHKNLLIKQFSDILSKNLVNNHIERAESATKNVPSSSGIQSTEKSTLTQEKIQEISKELLKNSKAKDIIEYSRAIHAEMAAIIQLARNNSKSTAEAILYCTTYPCHNCARHIVCAGIVRVVYIEPYDKSLAIQLHDDSITHGDEEKKVRFMAFEGVSPKRYISFFTAGERKNNEGSATKQKISESSQVDSLYLDSYTDYETKVIAELDRNRFNSLDLPA